MLSPFFVVYNLKVVSLILTRGTTVLYFLFANVGIKEVGRYFLFGFRHLLIFIYITVPQTVSFTALQAIRLKTEPYPFLYKGYL